MDCRASRRRCGCARVHRAVRAASSRAGIARRDPTDPGPRGPAARRAPRLPRGWRRPSPRTPPAVGAPRTPASAPRPDPATARRRRCTPTAAPRPPPRIGSRPPDRQRSDPAGCRDSARRRCSARRAEALGAGRVAPAAVRTPDATRRTRVPSPTARLLRAPHGSRPPARARTRPAPSCRRRARRAGREPGSHRCEPPRAARRVSGIPRSGHTASMPTIPPSCRHQRS